MKLYDQLKKHPKKIALAVLLLLILWFCRSFFPMLFLWGDKVTITFNLPKNIQLKEVSAEYMSTDCQEYWYGTGNWANLYKDHSVIEKKINENQYQAKVFFKDNGLCQWRLESIYWQLEYQDIEKAYPQVAKNNGGRGTEFHGQQISFDKSRDGSENVAISTSFYPLIRDPAYYNFQKTRIKPITGDLLVFKRKVSLATGQLGLKTRHIDYTATVIEPPFDSIERIK